jgi:hypothetical protein
MNNNRLVLVNLLVLSCLISCSKATPVSVSECDKVVSHVKNVLGERAPSNSKMLKQCKDATDEARGCVLAANKPMKILQCDF